MWLSGAMEKCSINRATRFAGWSWHGSKVYRYIPVSLIWPKQPTVCSFWGSENKSQAIAAELWEKQIRTEGVPVQTVPALPKHLPSKDF